MHGIVKSVDVVRGIVLIESYGMQGGIVPYVPATVEEAAQFKAGQNVIYTKATRAFNVELDPIRFGGDGRAVVAPGAVVSSDGKVVR